MDTTVSPRIRLLALAGLLGALALAGGMFFMSRTQGEASAAAPLPPPAVVQPKPATKAQPAANAKPVAARAKAGKARPVVKASAKPAVRAMKAKPKPTLVAPNGLPTVIADQLARHKIVVASVYAGGAAVDRLALDEARAGAGDARVGFAAVDVSNKRIAAALAKKADVLTAPAVLVFGKDGQVKARLNGFADRLLVAELAASAG
jgi:hypothetical protein